jgi:hypothetical protein
MDALRMAVTEIDCIGVSAGAAKQVVNPLLENWVNSRATGESAAKAAAIVNGR